MGTERVSLEAEGDAFIVHDMGQGSVAFGVHTLGYALFRMLENLVPYGGETVSQSTLFEPISAKIAHTASATASAHVENTS